MHNRELIPGSLALEAGGVPAKGTPTVKSVDDMRIRSKATNKELDVTLTVSRWRDGGAVGKVRLGTMARGTDP